MADPRNPKVVTKVDLDRIRPWVGPIAHAARTGSMDPYHLAAIGYRESEYGFARGYLPRGDPRGRGDAGNGYGFFQIDRRFHARFLASEDSQSVHGQAHYAVRVFNLKKDLLAKVVVDPQLLLRCALASYNAGNTNVLAEIKKAGGDPDRATTGGDYSGWVLSRAEALRAAAPSLFPSASDGLVV